MNGEKPRSFLFSCLALFAVAFSLNMHVLGEYLSSPFAQTPAWDARNYWAWAREIAAGNVLGREVFHQPPLYPYALAAIVFFFGESLLPVYVFQAALSAASSVLVCAVVRRITLSVSAGIVGGVLFAFYGIQVFYSFKILSETLAVFVMLLAARLLYARPRLPIAFAAGVCFGFLALLKPHLIPVALLVPVHFALLAPTSRPGMMSAAFLLPVVFLLAAVAARNYAVGRDFVPVSSNGGACFYVGSHSGAGGVFSPVISWGGRNMAVEEKSRAEKMSGRKLKPSQVSAFWMKKGFDDIRRAPLAYFRLELAKAKYIFSGTERSSMYYLGFERSNMTPAFGLAAVNFYVIFPLFLAGAVACAAHWRTCFLPLVFAAVNAFAILVFFYDTRFMLTAAPWWIVIGVSGVHRVLAQDCGGRLVEMLKSPMLALLLFAVLVSARIYVRDRREPLPESAMWESAGEIYLEQNRLQEAMRAFAKSYRLQKTNFLAALGVAKVAFRQGRRDLAAGIYKDIVAGLGPDLRELVESDEDLDPIRAHIQCRNEPTAGLANADKKQ